MCPLPLTPHHTAAGTPGDLAASAHPGGSLQATRGGDGARRPASSAHLRLHSWFLRDAAFPGGATGVTGHRSIQELTALRRELSRSWARQAAGVRGRSAPRSRSPAPRRTRGRSCRQLRWVRVGVGGTRSVAEDSGTRCQVSDYRPRGGPLPEPGLSFPCGIPQRCPEEPEQVVMVPWPVR